MRIRAFSIASFFFVVTHLTWAQDNFSFGFHADVESSLHSIYDRNTTDAEEAITVATRLGYGHNFGLQFQYALSHFTIRTGVSLRQMKHFFKRNNVEYQIDLNDTRIGDIRKTIELNSTNIPLDVIYRLRRNESTFCGLGAIYRFRIRSQSDNQLTYIDNGEQNGTYTSDQSYPSSFSLKLFVGTEFLIQKETYWVVEPFVLITPNKFVFYDFQFKSKTIAEFGLSLRIRV